MASRAGYLAHVYIGGTPTTLTSEPCSAYTTVAKTYRVTNAVKRLLDPATAVVVKHNSGVTVSTANYTLDRLFSVVVFSTAFSVIGTVKITGKYIPLAAVAGANKYSLAISRTLLDDTDFLAGGIRTRQLGLQDVAVELSRWDPLDQVLAKPVYARTTVVLEIQPGGVGAVARGWFIGESDQLDGDVNGLSGETVKFNLANNGDTYRDFSWGTT